MKTRVDLPSCSGFRCRNLGWQDTSLNGVKAHVALSYGGRADRIISLKSWLQWSTTLYFRRPFPMCLDLSMDLLEMARLISEHHVAYPSKQIRSQIILHGTWLGWISVFLANDEIIILTHLFIWHTLQSPWRPFWPSNTAGCMIPRWAYCRITSAFVVPCQPCKIPRRFASKLKAEL